MKKMIKNWSLALLFVASLGGATVSVAMPQPVNAACSERLLTFPAWYKGLLDGNCEIKKPATDDKGKGLSTFIWTIALNVIETLLQLVGYIAVGFIIVGGYKYMIGAGSPDSTVKARKTILNAVIGLVISIFSVAIVNVVAGAL